eukprot:gnl/TRDRNA2_/TRDRNA2_85434_c1_seq1.p1 gnl/TRDRNA2_/TRDRNA2_85434_c1~~gnl/TRDRNA2_/TRDRNA2_85434_c1_seq1.p1  ORF type:complete len:175 (-),score=27.81 gnl/TRDRNA2_/TRDRNA2_85434_c1_seq1:151-603(-)
MARFAAGLLLVTAVIASQDAAVQDHGDHDQITAVVQAASKIGAETLNLKQDMETIKAVQANAVQASPLTGSKAFADVATLDEPAEIPRYDYHSSNDRQGIKGNPVIWTMCIVYSALVVMVLLMFVVWSDTGMKTTQKPKPEMGLPAGYDL